MGSAIAYEDVMSLVTVVFVLFFIILIPLVNLDRNRTEKARIDPFWQSRAGWLLQRAGAAPRAEKYVSAFDLSGHKLAFRVLKSGERLVEAVQSDSTIKIIVHDPKTESYRSMHVNARSGIIVYQKGWLRWSRVDREWFKELVSIDYGDAEYSKILQLNYRDWVDEDP